MGMQTSSIVGVSFFRWINASWCRCLESPKPYHFNASVVRSLLFELSPREASEDARMDLSIMGELLMRDGRNGVQFIPPDSVRSIQLWRNCCVETRDASMWIDGLGGTGAVRLVTDPGLGFRATVEGAATGWKFDAMGWRGV